jgi:pimeloyl-ACP methyl ester carboxylesterase
MIRVRGVITDRLNVNVREAGEGTVPVLLLHGNCSSGVFFEDLMRQMPPEFRCIAPDLRGYGETEALPIDATRGCGDWADDLEALAEALGLDSFHLAGWSMGAGVAMQYTLDHPGRVRSLTLIDPLSPFGFGGTKDSEGTPTAPDFAGSGGGTVNPEFVGLIEAQERGTEGANAPRNVMNSFYFKPPFRGRPEQEDAWVEGMLTPGPGRSSTPGTLSPHPTGPWWRPARKAWPTP